MDRGVAVNHRKTRKLSRDKTNCIVSTIISYSSWFDRFEKSGDFEREKDDRSERRVISLRV